MRIFLALLFLGNVCIGQNIKSFNNGELTLYYEEYGSGPPLYILTGGPGAPPEHPSYQIIDSLKTHYTCVLLHQRGSGRSRNIPINEQTIRIKNYVQDIELLRQKRKDAKIILLGISWGGLLAMKYATVHPATTAKLVLICSAPPSYKLWDVLYDNQYVRHSQVELDSMQSYIEVFSTKTDKELDSLKRFDPFCKEAVAYKKFLTLHVRAMHYKRNAVPDGFDELFVNFNFQPIPYIDREVMETKLDITMDLKKLDLPALIIYGRQDDQGESTFYLQKESLKNSEIYVIEKSGHIIWEDQPAEFYSVLKNNLIKKKL